MVIDEDPEKRIAELERQLAELKAALRANPPQFSDAQTGARQADADERARRKAQALWEGLWSGETLGPDGPSGPELAQFREAMRRAAADAGISPEKISDALRRGNVTIKTGHSVVYSGPDGPQHFGTTTNMGAPTAHPQPGLGSHAGFDRPQPRRKLSGANRFGAIVGMLAGVLGLCVGGAATMTALFPSSALWMSGIVCRSPYRLVSSTSKYSYKPGQSGTSVSYRCVSDTGWYDVSAYAVMGLQALVAALIVGAVVAVVRVLRRRV